MEITRSKVKTVTKLVVQFGTGFIVHRIISNNMPEDINPAQQVAVSVASFAIGGAVGERAAAYTDKLIDDLAEAHVRIVAARQ